MDRYLMGLFCLRTEIADDSAGKVRRRDDALEERWLAKFGQSDKWISCLTAAKVSRIRSENDEANAADA